MFTRIIAGAVFTMTMVTPGHAGETSSKAAGDMLNEISGEYLECSYYYTWSANCLTGYPDPRVPDLQAGMQHVGTEMLKLAISTARTVGVTDKALYARLDLLIARINAEVNNSCVNASVLQERYAGFCKILWENSDTRVGEIRLAETFWSDLYEAWQEKGKQAIADMIVDKPGDFVKVVASQMPKEFIATKPSVFELSDWTN